MRIAFAIGLALAACGGAPGPATTTTTTTRTPPTTIATCEGVKPRVEALSRAEAEQREPKRVDEYVSDNTTMIMNDCVRDPGRLAPCLASTPSVAQMEQECVIPIDDEGTEGEASK